MSFKTIQIWQVSTALIWTQKLMIMTTPLCLIQTKISLSTCFGIKEPCSRKYSRRAMWMSKLWSNVLGLYGELTPSLVLWGRGDLWWCHLETKPENASTWVYSLWFYVLVSKFLPALIRQTVLTEEVGINRSLNPNPNTNRKVLPS